MNSFEGGAARLGGGAHLDAWRRDPLQAPQRQIYWFPTFRETARAKRELDAMIRRVTESDELRAWLLKHDYRMLIGRHINHGTQRISPEPPFYLASLESLTHDVAESELLISDYSSVAFDFLLLERPQILFAFDRADYEKRRRFYCDYDSLDFAVHARNLDELVRALVEETWRAPRLVDAARRFRTDTLPPPAESYACISVDEIESIAAAEAGDDQE